MGSPKPLVMTRGGSFLARGIRHLWGACDQVVVVLGSNAERIIYQAHFSRPAPASAAP